MPAALQLNGGGVGLAAIDSLMAEYRVVDGSGTILTDSSGNGNHGVFAGSAPSWITNTGGLNFTASGQFVSLPAALNSARTVFLAIGFQPAGQVSNFICPLAGNGGPANSWGVMFNNAQASSPAVGGGYQISGFGGGQFNWHSYNNPVGTFLLSFALGQTGEGTIDRPYLNGPTGPALLSGLLVPFGTTGGKQIAGNFQLGGTAIGGISGASATWFIGQIYYAAFFGRQLTAPEISQCSITIEQALNQRGLYFNATNTTGADQFLAAGDSLTFGTATPTAYTQYLALNGTWNIANIGVPGQYVKALASNPYNAIPDSWYSSNAGRNCIVIWAGTNDFHDLAATPAQAIGNLAAYCKARRRMGWRVLVCTMISRAGLDPQKNAYNALIKSTWRHWADGLIDIASDPNLGADGAYANLTYFTADQIHITTLAQQTIVAPLVSAAVNQLFP